MVWLCFSAPEHHPRWLWWLPLRGAGCPALSAALPPQFNGLVTAELLAPFEQWRSLIPQPLAARHLRFLLRAIPDHRFEVQHLASITQQGLGRAGRDSLPGSLSAWYPHASARLRRPTALAGHVIGPALTAAQQVVALGNQAPPASAGVRTQGFDDGALPFKVCRVQPDVRHRRRSRDRSRLQQRAIRRLARAHGPLGIGALIPQNTASSLPCWRLWPQRF